MIGRLIKRNNLTTNLLSIEHDKNWVNTLQELLKNEELDERVRLVWAPLRECELAVESNTWYNLEVLNNEVSEKVFDMIIVDGPPAWEQKKEWIKQQNLF